MGLYGGLDLFNSFIFIVSYFLFCEAPGFGVWDFFNNFFSVIFLLPDLILSVDSFWQRDYMGYALLR